MVSKVSFQSANTQKNLWSAFQNNHGQTSKTVPNNPASAIQKNANDKVSSNENNSKNYSSYIWGGIIGAAIIGLGIWYYSKHGKKPIKTQEIPSPNSNTGFSFKDIITSFISKVSKEDKGRYERVLSQQKLRRASCFKLLKTEDDILPLEQFFALQNANIKNRLILPHILETQNLSSENTSNVGKVFFGQFKTSFEKRRYISGDTKEFLSALQDFTAQKSDNYTFMHIENFNEFLSDLNKPENVSLLEKFKTLLLQNEQKKLSYLTEKVDNYANIPIKKLSLEFKEGAKSTDFELNASHYDIAYTLKNKTEVSQKILDETRSTLKINREEIVNIINGESPLILFKTTEPKYADEFLNSMIKHTGNFLSDFDCSSKNINEIIIGLEKILENNLKIAGRTGKINFVRINNLERLLQSCDVNSPEYKKLLELLQKSNEKYKTVFVAYSKESNVTLEKIAKESGRIINYDSPYDERIFTKLHQEAIERLNRADFGSINTKNIETYYLNDLIAERAGASMENTPILGGIFLRGNSIEENEKVAKALLYTFGDLINHKKIHFNIKKPEQSFSEIYELAEKCGKEYAKTKQRTIIEIDNIDELMLHDIDGKLFELQAGFKAFVENCSKNNHVTVLVKTIRDIKDFEPSCIGYQRFSRLFASSKKKG